MRTIKKFRNVLAAGQGLLFGIVLMHGAVAQAGTSPSLIAHWPLDGGASDASGNGHDGVLTSKEGTAKPAPVAGKYGQAMRFDGDSAIEIPLDLDYLTYPALTITMWVKLDPSESKITNETLLSTGSGHGPHMSLSRMRPQVFAAGHAYGNNSFPLSPDVWHFVAATWDHQNGQLWIYWDNAEAHYPVIYQSRKSQGTYLSPRDPDAEQQGRKAKKRYLWLGAADAFGYKYPARGLAIDDLRIYSERLTPEQLSKLSEGRTDGQIVDQVNFQGPVQIESRQSAYPPQKVSDSSSDSGAIAEQPSAPDLADEGAASRQIGLSWTLSGADGKTATCTEVGVEQVSVLATPVGSGGTAHEEIFPCGAGAGTTGAMPLGDYTVVVSPLNRNGMAVLDTRPLNVSLGEAGATKDLGVITFDFGGGSTSETVEAPGQTDEGSAASASGGQLGLSWTLSGADGKTVTCTEVGVEQVGVLATPVGSDGAAHEEIFPCGTGAGTTGAMPLGDYTVVVSPLNRNGMAVLDTRPLNVSMGEAGATKDLGVITFDFGSGMTSVTTEIPSQADDDSAATTGTGRFALTWTLSRNEGGTITCVEVGAASVSVQATQVGYIVRHDATFPCEAGVATTDALPLGDYMVVVGTVNQTGAVMLHSRQIETSLVADGATKDLGKITFDFGSGSTSVSEQ